MNGTIGQMLTLTADIAETLLAIKDTDSSITPRADRQDRTTAHSGSVAG